MFYNVVVNVWGGCGIMSVILTKTDLKKKEVVAKGSSSMLLDSICRGVVTFHTPASKYEGDTHG